MTNKIRQDIQTALSGIFSSPNSLFYERARDNHPANYCVWAIDEFLTEDGKTLGTLEVNVMGYGTDTAAVEELADYVANLFDHRHKLTNDYLLTTYKAARQSITEEDTNVIMRRLTFDLSFYER